MKSFFQKMKKEEGFTLVELMVVVAIIGLLSAVAVPNFKKYQAKSKTSEAKLQLSALYTAEQAFFSDYNIYATCLNYMGYDPRAEVTSRYYAIGFNVAAAINNAAFDGAVISGLRDSAADGCTRNLGAAVTTALPSNAPNSFFPAGKGVGSVMANQAFFQANAAAAAGNCAAAGSNPTGGNCIGDQAGTGTMTFQAAAVGVISGDNITGATASGLTINNTKLIRSVVNGY